MGFCCRPYAAAVALVLALSTLVHTQAPATKRVLFLTHAGLYKHPSLGPAEAAVTDLGQDRRLRGDDPGGLQGGGARLSTCRS